MEQENSSANSAEDLNPDVDLTQDDGLAVDSGDFFESLDRKVNGMILDDHSVGEVEEQENQQKADPSVDAQPDDHQHDWEKRYKDSSRAARKIKEQLDEYSQYGPLLNRLKEDTGMVDAIKHYVDNGNKPQDV